MPCSRRTPCGPGGGSTGAGSTAVARPVGVLVWWWVCCCGGGCVVVVVVVVVVVCVCVCCRGGRVLAGGLPILITVFGLYIHL